VILAPGSQDHICDVCITYSKGKPSGCTSYEVTTTDDVFMKENGWVVGQEITQIDLKNYK
jgi:hypothetical protein